MAHVTYTGDAKQLFGVQDQIIAKFRELQRLNTQFQVRAHLERNTFKAVENEIKAHAATLSRSVKISVKTKLTGIVEAHRALKQAFKNSAMVQIRPYITNASLKTVKDKIKGAVIGGAVEIGLRFQTGAAGKFRDTLRRMLAVLSRGSYVEVEVRAKMLQRALDQFKGKKVLLDVDFPSGTAAKMKSILGLLGSYRNGAKIPVRFDIDPAAAPLIRQLANDLKDAASQAKQLADTKVSPDAAPGGGASGDSGGGSSRA